MNVRYRVTLTQYERNELRAILNGGKSPARKLKRAQILLAADAGASDEDIAKWLDHNGIPKGEKEKQAWSEQVIKENPYHNPEKRDWYIEQLKPLGLDPKTTPMFDWLETDDRVSYKKAA